MKYVVSGALTHFIKKSEVKIRAAGKHTQS
jgi:hypothetical protein